MSFPNPITWRPMNVPTIIALVTGSDSSSWIDNRYWYSFRRPSKEVGEHCTVRCIFLSGMIGFLYEPHSFLNKGSSESDAFIILFLVAFVSFFINILLTMWLSIWPAMLIRYSDKLKFLYCHSDLFVKGSRVSLLFVVFAKANHIFLCGSTMRRWKALRRSGERAEWCWWRPQLAQYSS